MSSPTGMMGTLMSFETVLATVLPWSDPVHYAREIEGTPWFDDIDARDFLPGAYVVRTYEGHDDFTVSSGMFLFAINTGAGNDYVDMGGLLTDHVDNTNYIYLGDGHDTYHTAFGSFNDVISGGNGNDVIYAGEGDHVYGGAGHDFIHTVEASVDVMISGGTQNDRIYLDGDFSQGTLFGDEGHDFLYGGDYGDTLFGGVQNDTIYGGRGDDFISGDEGYNKLYGEQGADTFYFSVLDGKMDDVFDFSAQSSEEFSENPWIYDLFFKDQNDHLDVSVLLTDFDPLTDDITDFVNITDRGDYHVLKVDPDGGEYSFVNVARIHGSFGGDMTDEQQLLDDGILIV